MAATDLLSDTEARAVISMGAADSSKADALTRAITAVSTRLAASCGTIIQGTITGELHDGGQSYVYLKASPVVSVTTVVEYDGTTAGTLTAETNSSKPDASYHVNKVNGKLYRRHTGGDVRFIYGRQNISVTYVAGRCADTASVSPIFKEAAAITLKNWWRMYEAGNAVVQQYDVPQASFPTFAIPKAAKELLGNEWRTGSGIGD